MLNTKYKNKTKATTTKLKTTLDPDDCVQWENKIFTPAINQSESAIFHCAKSKNGLGVSFICNYESNTCLLQTLSSINPLGKLIGTPIIVEISQKKCLIASGKTKFSFFIYWFLIWMKKSDWSIGFFWNY